MTSDVLIYSPTARARAGHNHEYSLRLSQALCDLGFSPAVVAGPGPRQLPAEFTAACEPELEVLLGRLAEKPRSPRLHHAVLPHVFRMARGKRLLLESPEYLALGARAGRLPPNTSVVVHDLSTTSVSVARKAYILMRSAAFRRLGKHVDQWIVHGHSIGDRLAEMLDTPTRVTAVGYPNLGPGDETSPPTWDGATAPRLLLFGTLRRDKAIPEAVAALSVLPDATLTIAGAPKGVDPERVREEAHRLGVDKRLTVIGRFLPDDEVERLFAAHDVILGLYRDHAEHDSGGVALARQFLRPVVVAGGRDLCQSIAQDRIGEVSQSTEPGDIAAAVHRLQADWPGPSTMEERLRLAARRRSWAAAAEQISGAWD